MINTVFGIDYSKSFVLIKDVLVFCSDQRIFKDFYLFFLIS